MKRIIVFILLTLFIATFANAQTWNPLNGPFGNRVYSILETQNGNMLAATTDHVWVQSGGLWQIATFTGVTKNLTQPAAAFKPMVKLNNNDLLYSDLEVTNNKLWKSSDNGVTWNMINATGLPGRAINCFTLDTANTTLAGINHTLANPGGGVYKSTDNGVTWNLLGLSGISVRSIAVRTSDGYMFAGTANGVYRSVDLGGSWTQINSGLTNTDINSITVKTGGYIFVGSYGKGAFRSTDNGDNWTNVGPGDYHIFPMTVKNNGTIFIGTVFDNQGAFNSTDNGVSWQQINTGFISDVAEGLTVWSLGLDGSGNVFTGTQYDGVFKSTDNGANWNQIGIPVNIKATATNGNNIFVSGGPNFPYRSTDNGVTWKRLSASATDALVIDASGNVFAGTPGNGIRKSTDNGVTWASTSYPRSSAQAIAVHPDGSLFAGGQAFGIYKSTDDGTTWSWADNGLTKTVWSIAISNVSGSSGYIYVGTSGSFAQNPSGVFRSTDNGATWDSVGLGQYTITTLSVDLTGQVFAGTKDGVYKSTNYGVTWTLTGNTMIPKAHSPFLGSTALTNPTDVLSLMPGDTAVVFAGTDGGGAYRSPDNGATWYNASSGLTDTKVSAFSRDNDGRLLVGTDAGLFRSTELVSEIKPPLAPDLVSPINGASGTSLTPTFIWKSALTATSYELQIAEDSAFGNIVSDIGGLTDTTSTVSSLSGNSTYYWRVNASNVWGGGLWSSVRYFTTTAGPPAPPLLLSPQNGEQYVPLITTLRWKHVVSATQYEFQLSSDSLFGTTVANDTINDTLVTNLSLDGGSPYYWRVRGLNTYVGTWSSTFRFTTVPSSLTYNYSAGWNILSLPLETADPTTKTLFPSAISKAFEYSGSYISQDTLHIGKGFWLKFGSSGTRMLTGNPILRDTIDVKKGWNIIGSLMKPIPISTIATIPSGIITSNFFAYNGISYVVVSTIEEGRGYWVKTNANGKLILGSPEGEAQGRIRLIRTPDGETPPPAPESPDKVIGIPNTFALYENYPNPFNPTTTIAFDLPEMSSVKLTVYNLLGQTVATLMENELKNAGRYTISFDASRLSSGIYLYRLDAGSFRAIRKMLLVK